MPVLDLHLSYGRPNARVRGECPTFTLARIHLSYGGQNAEVRAVDLSARLISSSGVAALLAELQPQSTAGDRQSQ